MSDTIHLSRKEFQMLLSMQFDRLTDRRDRAALARDTADVAYQQRRMDEVKALLTRLQQTDDPVVVT